MDEKTNSLFSLAESIDKFGPYAVILAVVLLIFLYVIHSNNKMYNKFQSQLLENNDEYKNSMADFTTKMVNQLLETKNKMSVNPSIAKWNVLINGTDIKTGEKQVIMPLKHFNGSWYMSIKK